MPQQKPKVYELALVASQFETPKEPFANLDPESREKYLRAIKAGQEFNEKILGATMTNENEEPKHATFSASGSHGWLNCPGKINAERGIPDKGSVHAEEGTVAHHLAELALTHEKPAEFWKGNVVIVKNGEVYENRLELSDAKRNEQIAYGNSVYDITDEMCSYVQEYLDYVNAIPAGDAMIETRVDFSPWTTEGQFGTADYIGISEDGKRAVIVDLKYGKGNKVFAEKNSQAMLYALGVIEELDLIYDVEEFLIVIHQPRLDHVDEWHVTKEELLEWGETTVRPAVKIAMTEDAPRIAGDLQCKYCLVQDDCPAAVEYMLEAVAEDFDMADFKLKEDGNLDISAKIFIHERRDFIRKLLDAVEASLHKAIIEDGDEVPGYKIVEGRSQRKWKDPETVEELLKKNRNIKADDMYKKELKGPAPIEKILGKDHKILKEHVHKPKGKPTLVLESDKREAMSFDCEEDFDGIE